MSLFLFCFAMDTRIAFLLVDVVDPVFFYEQRLFGASPLG